MYCRVYHGPTSKNRINLLLWEYLKREAESSIYHKPSVCKSEEGWLVWQQKNKNKQKKTLQTVLMGSKLNGGDPTPVWTRKTSQRRMSVDGTFGLTHIPIDLFQTDYGRDVN